jgi:hypothetical protein
MDFLKWKRVWKYMTNAVHESKLNTRKEPHGISALWMKLERTEHNALGCKVKSVKWCILTEVGNFGYLLKLTILIVLSLYPNHLLKSSWNYNIHSYANKGRMWKLPSTWIVWITKGARLAPEIKCRIVMAKAAFKRQESFHHQNGLKLKEKTSTVLYLEYTRSFV